jgi:hypothetical protein
MCWFKYSGRFYYREHLPGMAVQTTCAVANVMQVRRKHGEVQGLLYALSDPCSSIKNLTNMENQ